MLARSDEIPKQRTNRLQERLQEEDADAMILSKGVDQYYFSGFYTSPQKRHLFYIVPATGEPLFFIPEPYRSQLSESTWVERVYTWEDTDNPVAVLEDVLSESNLLDADLVLVNEEMWGLYLLDLMDIVGAEFEIGTDLLMEPRSRKDSEERRALREASTISDEVSETIRSMDIVGWTENELAAEIEYRLRQKGGGDHGHVQVASGPNSAKPPHDYSYREIEPGDPVILDFGASLDGYISDQCRTFVPAGEPPEGFVDAHEAVRDAQEAAIDAIEPGVEAGSIDRVARSHLEEAGYGENFLHITGHGLGLGIHEPPYLMSGDYIDESNRQTLEPGMVTTVEPGVYTGDWGIRIEDAVAITEDGFERLNRSNYGWNPL